MSPPDASFLEGFNILVYVIIGGSATLLGPLIGTGFVIGITEALRFAELYRTLLFSAVVFLVLMFFRGGIAGTVARGWTAVAARRQPGASRRDGSPRPDAGLPAEGSPRPWRGTLPVTDDAPAEDDAPVLECRDLTKRFGGVCAVSEVSLSARRGEIVGVIGPNGAGKSTLFGLISGVVGVTGGQVRFRGEDLGRIPAHRRARLGIARTFQTNRLLSEESVWENLLTARGRGTQSVPIPEAAEHLDYLNEIVDLLELNPEATVSGLSVEEQKLVGVGMALALRPRLLLLDEPFAGLRESETPRLSRVLATLRSRGLTILLVEHKMRVVMSLCDRVYVLDSGNLIAEGTAQEVAGDQRVINAYLGTKSA